MTRISELTVLFLIVAVLSGCGSRGAVAPMSASGHVDSLSMAVMPDEAQTGQIALLLPLSGPQSGMGRSVRDGFLSAYYEQGAQKMTLQMYDTGGTAEKTRTA